jgi:hypothetical protein
MTLGRTQPPHQAHFHMLVEAARAVSNRGQLIHFVSSSNVPISVSAGSLNILTTDERIQILTECLAHRVQGTPFQCIPLPDFSDPQALFDTPELQQARISALQLVKGGAFQVHVRERRLTYSDTYFAWAVHLKTLLDQIVNAYVVQHPESARPTVTFFACVKDHAVKRYVELIEDIVHFLQADSPCPYDFKVEPVVLETLNGQAINATEIREALIAGLQSGKCPEIPALPSDVLEMIWEMLIRRSHIPI